MQNTATATTKWLDIGDWDVSIVKDFSYAFSVNRDEAGSNIQGGNPKASGTNAIGLSKWSTTSVTSLSGTFEGAKAWNGDVSKWDVAKVRVFCTPHLLQ